ncbi:uncharacterized protein Z519_04299 [Cladophialophora bantiana CBS 173.52]|uniref:Uncharacterized protein n=1 Tax=Cladophialophora bantiana (strain ATCC 10958 / CBS 173.52 / CDC B-1940 / NIH 8579) TaxID=1442370 RepID=A0A0D2IG27_CLAB1|nr:uncharacterized protein Z519_04299 [Cladophialophora bantiana CBS 173.52]KIW95714.1 hypothetical protein Z519_04299 [Cladophialophora bantiana CBS 173.52]
MAGAREIPAIVVTPPSEDGPTSTVSILMTRHWGLWTSGTLRKLDRTNAKGENYLTSGDDDIKLVELLPRNDPPADRLKPTIDLLQRLLSTKEFSKGTEAPKSEDEIKLERLRKSDSSTTTKHTAVLESIKFRGEMMHAFEQECKKPWFNVDEFEDDLPPLLPPTRHIRIKAEELLKEFAESPIADVRDLLEARRQRETSVCKAWYGILKTHEQQFSRSPLFEPILDLVTGEGLDDWKDDNCQAWEEIMA